MRALANDDGLGSMAAMPNLAADIMLWGTALAFLPYIVVLVIEAQLPSITIPGGRGSHLFILFFIFLPVTFTYSILKNHKLLKGKEFNT